MGTVDERSAVVRVAVVSPGDVVRERRAAQRVVDELNRGVAADRRCQLSLWRWETNARPGVHLDGPQGLIDDLMEIQDADVVVGVFWKSFGTPTKEAGSGTEHELRRAWAAWQDNRSPEVMVYFCTRRYAPETPEEVAEWGRVLDFRRAMPEEQFWWRYTTVTEFEALLREHLTRFLLKRLPTPERRSRQTTEPGVRSDLTAVDTQVLLERALNYRQYVRILHERLNVPDQVIATVANVHPGTVRRWRSASPELGEPRHAQAKAIEKLRRIALVLIASGTFVDLEGVGVWLRAGCEGLGWQAPYEVLANDPENGFEMALWEAEHFVRPGAGAAHIDFTGEECGLRTC